MNTSEIISTNLIDSPTFWREYPDRDIEFVRWYPCDIRPLHEKGIFRPRNFVYYVHIPFCNNVCFSCPYNKFNTRSEYVTNYLEALKREIVLYATKPYLQDGQFVAGYIGGGTPTILSTKQLDELLSTIAANLQVKRGATFTIESTPVDINEEKAEILLKHGIDRISLGVQSFDNELLKNIGRTHSRGKAIDVINMLNRVGFKHICVDLMLGLPGQTLEQWHESLDILMSLPVNSFSFYTYLVMPSSPLFLKLQRGIVPNLPNKDLIDKMYFSGIEKVLSNNYCAVTNIDFVGPWEDVWKQRGVKRYEIGSTGYYGMDVSSFPLTAHLTHTWYQCGDMLSLGAGAYGYINDHMYLNEPDLEKYIASLNSNTLPVAMGSVVGPRERMSRSLVLGIKLLRVSRKDFLEKHGVDMMDIFAKEINQLVAWGLLKMDDEALRVTYPKGWYYIDNISKMFYTKENYKLPQPSSTSTNILKWLKK